MTGLMEDMFEAPPPSVARPAAYGAACGVALTLIFFLSYLLAPGLPLGGTTLIAAGVLAILAMILNYVPSRAGDDLAAMSMGEAPAPLTGESAPASAAGPAASADDIAIGEMEARVSNRRAELAQIDRGAKPVEWVAKVREMADAQKELATRELTLPQRKRQKAGLGHMRQAMNAYRKVVDARSKNRSEGQWALAQIALAECQLVLGEAEGARDQVMMAVNGFTAALEVSELLPAERRAGENGLAQAEGVLAGMAEMDRPDPGDDFM